jgi:hypothetical protein
MKILPISLLLIFATGCERPYQRFIPAPAAGSLVLVDTKTGRFCDGGWPQQRSDILPLCYDLYKSGK